MNESSSVKRSSSDHRSRLYERYVTLQLQMDLGGLQRSIGAAQPALERTVRKFFPENKAAAILDMGCGYGLLLHVLQRMGYRNLTGIETSPEQVKAAHALGVDCVTQGDLGEVLRSAPAQSWDVIVAFDVLEHFTKDEILNVLEMVFRCLKPGGILLLHVPNGEAIFSGKIFFGDFTHQVAFTHKSMHQVAAYAGFAKVTCYEDKPVPHGVISLVRAMLWAMVRSWYRFVNAVETGDPGGNLIFSQNFVAVCRKSAAVQS
ncbi:MAG TPA: class I SAM-dependent methyltransferase [Terriglobales bacterium]|nr:class I SAM-dependent methyltransferase [Terriglobales bacterium]